MMKRLSKQECLSLLEQCQVGHLGCISERGPYIVPVHYIFHDGDLYLHSRMGEKIRLMRQNSAVCLQVEKVEDASQWRSAMALGRYEEVSDADQRQWFNRRILTRFPHLTPVESIDAQGEIVIFRIRIEEVSGVGEG